MSDEELKVELIRASQAWYEKGCARFRVSPRMLSIRFDLRGTSAGRAHSAFNIVQYNLILARENTQDFIENTVPHEIAHLIADLWRGYNVGHGKYWKLVMTEFGREPERCHSYDVTNARVRHIKRYKVVCTNCASFLGMATAKKKARIERLAQFVQCRRCKAMGTIQVSDIPEYV